MYIYIDREREREKIESSNRRIHLQNHFEVHNDFDQHSDMAKFLQICHKKTNYQNSFWVILCSSYNEFGKMRAKRSTWKCLSACYVTCIICLYVPLAFHTCNIVMEMILTYFRSMFLSHENRTFDFAINPVD